MGLHSIAEDASTISYHCHSKDCAYHNCQNWEPYQQCPHHDNVETVTVAAADMKEHLRGKISDAQLEQVNDTLMLVGTMHTRTSGETITVPVDHPDIVWTGEHVVALPPCPGCGSSMFLKVHFTAEELRAPNIRIIQRDPRNPTLVKSISQHPMVARHQTLAAKLVEIGNVYKPE